MDGIPANPWEWVFYGGGVGSLALVAWLLATGRLVPRATHDRELEHRDATIERLLSERNRFIEIAMRSTRAGEELAGPQLERVAHEAAVEAIRRAGSDP